MDDVGGAVIDDQRWLEHLEPEWLEWYSLTPQERWRQTCELWDYYLSIGGSLDPDPDPDSPFWDDAEREQFARSAPPSRITLKSRSGV